MRLGTDEGGKTRVDLEHMHLDRHGKDWEKLREGVSGQGGWPSILADVAKAVA